MLKYSITVLIYYTRMYLLYANLVNEQKDKFLRIANPIVIDSIK